MTNQFKKKEVWLNTYPIFLWLVSEPLVGLIDSKIASYIDIDVLSAVGIGETVYFVFIWIFVFLAYGTTPYVSNLHATRQIHKLNYFITFGRKSSVLIGLISAGLLIFASAHLIKFFEPTIAVSYKANSYLILRSLGLPFYLLNMHSTAVLRGMKYPKITLYSSAIVGVANVILSYFLGIVLSFGVEGIAIASSIAFLISSIYSTRVLINTQTQTSNIVKTHEKKEISKKFFSIGFFIFIRSMFLTLFMAYLRNQASLMSMSEIALQHVLLQLWSFGYVFVDALAIAAQTLVAEHKAKFNVYKNSELNSLTFKIAIFLFITSFIFLENIVLLITEASLVLIIDNELKTLFALSLLIGSFAFLWDGVLLGLDKSKQFSIMTVVSSLIGFLSCIYLLSQDNSLSSLWIGLNLSLLYRGLIGFYIFKENRCKIKY
jgi:MATE family multidrug resistance protein